MTKQTIHQMARADAIKLVYTEGPNPETLNSVDRATLSQQTPTINFLSPFVFIFMYLFLYAFYGVQKLRGNLKNGKEEK